MQSFTKQTDHHNQHRKSLFDDENENNNMNVAFNGFNALNSRSLFNLAKANSPKNKGRLDLSFTKCNFPEDYLPYAGSGKKRMDTNHDLNYRSSAYDNLAFGSSEDFSNPVQQVGYKSSHSPQFVRSHEPLSNQTPKYTHHLSSATSFAAPFTSTYNSLERGRRGLYSSNLVSVYHDPYHRVPNGALTLPLPLPSSSSTSSSSCLTTHHLHPSTRTVRGRKLAKSCGCCVLMLMATLILVSLSLVVGFSLYLAVVTNFLSKTPLVYSISGNFKVTSGDNFNMRLLNQTSEDYIRRSTRYENIMQHILDKSLIADSVLKSEVYSFRKGSLIVFFRFFTSKSKMDSLLDIHSKAVINLSTIESVYIDDSVILGKLRDIVRNAFRASKSYLSQSHGDIVIDIDSLKIGHIDQMIEQLYRLDRDKSVHKESVPLQTTEDNNVNSHKVSSIVTRSDTSSPHSQTDQDQSKFAHVSTPADSPQWLPVSSSTSTTTSTVRPTVSANIVRVTTHSTVTLHTERQNHSNSAVIDNKQSALNNKVHSTTNSGGSDDALINWHQTDLNPNNAFRPATVSQVVATHQTENKSLPSENSLKDVKQTEQSQNIHANELRKISNNTSLPVDVTKSTYDRVAIPTLVNENMTNDAAIIKNEKKQLGAFLNDESSHQLIDLKPAQPNEQTEKTKPNEMMTSNDVPSNVNNNNNKSKTEAVGNINHDDEKNSDKTIKVQDNQSHKKIINESYYNATTGQEELNEFSLPIESESKLGNLKVHSVDSIDDDAKAEGREDIEDENEEVETSTVVTEGTTAVEINTKSINKSDIWDLPEEDIKTARPEVKPTTQPSVDTLPNTLDSIDGFAIAGNENPIKHNSNITKHQTEWQLPVMNSSASKLIDRELIASAESFDLYSLRGTTDQTSIGGWRPELPPTEESIDQKLTTLSSLTTMSNKPVQTSGHSQHNNDNEFLTNEQEEFLLFSSRVDGASFGKRISKKLNVGFSKLDSYGGNSLFQSDKGDKLKEVTKIVNGSIEQFNDINGPHLKDHEERNWHTTTVPPTTTTIAPCESKQFHCAISGECISLDQVCNRIVDCTDRSDEVDCRCVDYIRKEDTHKHKICDGIVDCHDQSDEQDCAECHEGMFVCSGHQNQCIEQSKVCNGENDCFNGDDEHGCITLANPTDLVPNLSIGQHFNSHGILFIRHHGQWGPLCFDNYDVEINDVLANTSLLQVDDMGQAVCKANYFAQLESVHIVPLSTKYNFSFYSISPNISNDLKPTLSLWSSLFEQSTCAQRKVARIECSNLECGIRPVSSKLRRRIIGGQSSSFGSWPWQVALYREGDFQCGAVIIDSQWLLTAAHCFYSSPSTYWTARAGVLRRGNLLRSYHEEIRRIDHIFIHPEYVDKGFLNDIALLRLDRPLRFSKYIRTICLPDEQDSVNNWHNQLCTTVGWGKLYEHGRIFPDTLQEVKLPIITSEECRKRTLFLPLYKITDNMFCAGFERGGRDACLGDSGGPMMCQRSDGSWLLLGITSNGDGCGRAGRPGVYTKVANYLNWIHNITSTVWPPTLEPKCGTHRCPLGKCLRREQVCDSIIDCEDSSDELSCK